jgi:(p)ppGpp synthase/HD superfamily hydrolase
VLTKRFEEALLYTVRLHADQKRKRSEVPYFAHLLGVTGLVLEDGGDEDEAIAALLHDAVEDQGGLPILDEIRARFGPRVADMVFALSDSYTSPKPPWRERKEKYIASLRYAESGVIRISMADKVYNARTTLNDIHKEGEFAWERFNGGREGTLWYYQQLIQAFLLHGMSNLLQELIKLVGDLEMITDEDNRNQEVINNSAQSE